MQTAHRGESAASAAGAGRIAAIGLAVGAAIDRHQRLIVELGFLALGVGDAAQRQRQDAHLAGAGQRFGLPGLQLERGGLADQIGLAVLLLGRLVDREHADVRQDHLGDDDLGDCRIFGMLLAAGEDHVDPVVRQDEAAGAGFRRDFGRHRARAARQDRGHEAGAGALDQLLLADRLARDDGVARDRAGDLGHRVRAVGLLDEAVAGGRRRPGLPHHVLGLDGLAEADVGLGDQHVHGRQLRDRFGGSGLAFVGSAGEPGGDAPGAERNTKDDDTCGFHTLLLFRASTQHWPRRYAAEPGGRRRECDDQLMK